MPTLSDTILEENISSVRQKLRYVDDINQIDEYGFTPLIESAIVDNIEIAKLLLENRANPNQQDVTGGTALQWASENNNLEFCKVLMENHANPNMYSFSGQPILVMPTLRQQRPLRQLLIKGGADAEFAQDYINTKLLGHMFELVGTVNIISPNNQFVDVDFEGFYLETTIGLIADSLAQFQNHFAARQLRRYAGVASFIVEVMQRASELIKYQQYRVDIKYYEERINELIEQEPLIVPVGYEGHAITFIKYGNVWVKCDRREDSRLYDNVVFYNIGRPDLLTRDFIKKLMYEKQSDKFINEKMDSMLGLEPITELRVEAQISGNCSWANVEATIPALFFLVLMKIDNDEKKISHHKTLALNFFHRLRDWNKERALNFCIQRFKESDSIRKACHAEILAAVLFQTFQLQQSADKRRIETILSLLINSPYEYILRNYVRVYFLESPTEEGKMFTELLKEHGFKV